MLALFSDFTRRGGYVGQMAAAARNYCPAETAILDLCHDAPFFRPDLAGYLLAAQASAWVWPAGTVFVAVVDPGVGTARGALVARAGAHWFVAPDNGLLAPVLAQAREAGRDVACYRLAWDPGGLSASFHGRDLFAPAGARLVAGDAPPLAALDPAAVVGANWPADWDGVIYRDGFGNCVTGRRAATLPARPAVQAAGRAIPWGRTFADVPVGAPLAYANSDGLAELAVNQGSAAAQLGLDLGDPVGLAAG